MDDRISTALKLKWCVTQDRSSDVDEPAGIRPAGHFHPLLPARLMVCGSAAERWLAATRDAGSALAALHTTGARALLLAGDGVQCPHFRQAATRSFGGDVAQSPLPESRMLSALRDWHQMQRPPTLAHGVLLQVFGLGILLTGGSGTGKSELALELLSRGHHLVADDVVELRRVGTGGLIGCCPALLRGFIGTRSLGILDAGALYGDDAVVDRSRVDLILDLDERGPAAPTPDSRLCGTRGRRDILGVTLPVISLSGRLGHNLAVIAEAGCRDHWLRLGDYHADAQFIKRQQRHIDADASLPHPHGIR